MSKEIKHSFDEIKKLTWSELERIAINKFEYYNGGPADSEIDDIEKSAFVHGFRHMFDVVNALIDIHNEPLKTDNIIKAKTTINNLTTNKDDE